MQRNKTAPFQQIADSRKILHCWKMVIWIKMRKVCDFEYLCFIRITRISCYLQWIIFNWQVLFQYFETAKTCVLWVYCLCQTFSRLRCYLSSQYCQQIFPLDLLSQPSTPTNKEAVCSLRDKTCIKWCCSKMNHKLQISGIKIWSTPEKSLTGATLHSRICKIKNPLLCKIHVTDVF